MSYISDIVKLVKGGKESFVKKMKLYFYIAIGIAIYILVFGFVLLITHAVIMFTKNVPVINSCPYNYSSFGLNAETSFPIIGTVVDTVVGVIYSNKRDPVTCQKTCEKRCASSEDQTCLENCKYDCRYNGIKGGVLNGYRDSILNNLNFQIIRTILVVFVISILGVTFLFGFTPMRASELLKKLAILGLFLFATDSRSYILYDQFIEPLVLEGSKQLSGMINGMLLASMDSPELIAYSNAHPNNEFIVLDASISIFFSQAIFDKMGALTFTDMGFMFMAPIFYLIATWITINYFFFSVIVVFYRVVIVVGLSLFPMFVLFTAMAVTSKSLDKTTKYFTNYIQEVLIKPTIAIFFLTYVMSFFAMLILELVLGVFSFQVCVKRVFDPLFGLDFVLPTFDYYEAVRPFSTRDVAGTILGFNTSALDIPYINPTTNQVNPASLEKRGNSDILFSMMILNFILLSLYGILFRKIFGFVIQTAEKLNAAFGGSGLGDGQGGGFKDITDKASEYGGKAANLASQKIEAAGDFVMSKAGVLSQEGIASVRNEFRSGAGLPPKSGNADGASKPANIEGGNVAGEVAGDSGGGGASEPANESVGNVAGDGGESAGGAPSSEDSPAVEGGSPTESGNGGGSSKPTNVGGGNVAGDGGESAGGAPSSGNSPAIGGASPPKIGNVGGASKLANKASENEASDGAGDFSGGGAFEPANRGGGEPESEKEIQKDRDVIKKTIRNKQNIETEEVEEGGASSKQAAPTVASNGPVTASQNVNSTPTIENEDEEESTSEEGDEEDVEEGGDAQVTEPPIATDYNEVTQIEQREAGETGGTAGEADITQNDELQTPEETPSFSSTKADQDTINGNINKEGSTNPIDRNVNAEGSTSPKKPESPIISPLGHEANTALGHEGNKAFEHGANNPIKDEINNPFNVEPSTEKENGVKSFENKIEKVEVVAKSVAKKAELMKKVQAAKEKKNFLDQNVKAVSNKEDIAKFRKKSSFLNNQNKDKK